MLRTLLVYVVLILFLVILGPPLILWSAIKGNTDTFYRVGVFSARAALRLAGVSLRVTGREKIPAGKAVVFMPNHQSNCDPPAVAAVLPPILIMAKREFFRVPIMGTAMRMRGFIPVDRSNREQAYAAVDKGVASLRAGHSFLAFPEGTRSRTGRLQAFKKGIFVMAIKAGAPIVPISLSGAYKIMPRGDFRIRPGPVRITIHDPIPTACCSIADCTSLAEQVRRAMIEGLLPEERPLALHSD
ncbi:MAG: 1-acyl-sn-glycerol-3-phosphate acyltransferase [Acidobacteria bacterium]|nr:MAG: 1-acyl-sn-glycerol-3-phosphate acyltransferase [Acidobacteriota bacterium]